MNENKQTTGSIDINLELSKGIAIHSNVKQEIILTTSDKLKLVLIDTKESLSIKKSWMTPLGLFISFIITLSTANFKKAFSLTADTWCALFIFFSIASFIWLMICIIKLIKNWDGDNLDKIISKIKLRNEEALENDSIE